MVRGVAAHAERVEALATAAAQARHDITAREIYLRACNYYHLAERFLPLQDERKLTAYRKALFCFAQAAVRFTPPVERVEIPSEGSALPAYFVPARGAPGTRAPTVISFDGLDAIKEQLYLIGGRELVRCGLACLVVDGPGNGEALRLRNLYLRPEYERRGCSPTERRANLAAGEEMLRLRGSIDQGAETH